MNAIELFGTACLFVGAAFFFAGTVGLLRFPDVYARLHALAKADNLGLGFTMLGLATQSDNLADAAKLLLVWLLTMAASTIVCFLIARRAHLRGVPWRQQERNG